MENNFSMLNLFTGDLMTLFVSLVLVGFSVWSWAIIIEKIRLWKSVLELISPKKVRVHKIPLSGKIQTTS